MHIGAISPRFLSKLGKGSATSRDLSEGLEKVPLPSPAPLDGRKIGKPIILVPPRIGQGHRSGYGLHTGSWTSQGDESLS